jgi:hypothetical protein
MTKIRFHMVHMGIELSDSLSSIPMLTRRSETIPQWVQLLRISRSRRSEHWLDAEVELEERSDLLVSEA